MKLEEMSAKDLFLAFYEKAGIKIEVDNPSIEVEADNPSGYKITLHDDGEWVDFVFDENGNFNSFYCY